MGSNLKPGESYTLYPFPYAFTNFSPNYPSSLMNGLRVTMQRELAGTLDNNNKKTQEQQQHRIRKLRKCSRRQVLHRLVHHRDRMEEKRETNSQTKDLCSTHPMVVIVEPSAQALFACLVSLRSVAIGGNAYKHQSFVQLTHGKGGGLNIRVKKTTVPTRHTGWDAFIRIDRNRQNASRLPYTGTLHEELLHETGVRQTLEL